MSREILKNRINWQNTCNQQSIIAEENFFSIFEKYFQNTEYSITKKPQNFRNIYSNLKLSDELKNKIFNPPKIGKWGFIPDFSIKNINTNKIIFGDIKKQDGWVEGGRQNDGRGNAHERMGKYFTPGIRNLLQQHSGIKSDKLPFWFIFEGNITRDPRRVREISFWFDNYQDNFYMWDSAPNGKSIIEHFNNKIHPLLINL